MLKLIVNNPEEDIQVIEPKLQTKGKGPTDEDWLSPMKCGTEFLVKPTTMRTWQLAEFTHGGNKEGNVLLIPTLTLNDNRTWMWVDPIEFCKAFSLRAILEVPSDD